VVLTAGELFGASNPTALSGSVAPGSSISSNLSMTAPSNEDSYVSVWKLSSDNGELFGMDGLHEMLSRCDVAVIAAPATDDTHHLVDATALAALPKGGIVVNVARGSLMDTEAFIDAMERGHLAAAALDVFEEEPLPPESPLWDLPNLLISAHSSVSTDRYAHDLFELFVDNLGRYVRGEPLRNQVDMDALGFA